MTTSTLHFVSDNAALSSLAASISRFFSATNAPVAQGVQATGGQSLMDLYRLTGSGDSVSPDVADALARFAAD